MKADLSQVQALVIDAARSLRAQAGAARHRARQTLAEDHSRRLRMRRLRLLSEQAADSAGANVMRPRPDRPRVGRRGDDPPMQKPQPFRVRSEAVTASRIVLRVTGEIDIETTPVLVEAVRRRLTTAEPGTELVADLTDVTFIDARGLAALIGVTESARARGVAFEVDGHPRCLLRLLELTGARAALDLR